MGCLLTHTIKVLIIHQNMALDSRIRIILLQIATLIVNLNALGCDANQEVLPSNILITPEKHSSNQITNQVVLFIELAQFLQR